MSDPAHWKTCCGLYGKRCPIWKPYPGPAASGIAWTWILSQRYERRFRPDPFFCFPSAVRLFTGEGSPLRCSRLKRPKANVIQKTDEKRPKSTTLRIVPISSSVDWPDDERNPTIVTTGRARLSTPRSNVDHAQTVPMVAARQRRNRKIPQPTATLHPIEKGPQTSQAPMVVTIVARRALSAVVHAGMMSMLKRQGKLGAVWKGGRKMSRT